MNLPRILLAGFDPAYLAFCSKILSEQAVVVNEHSAKGVEVLLSKEANFSAILITDKVAGDHAFSSTLTPKVRRIFRGPLVAVSDDPKLRAELQAAGCDHQSTRVDAPDIVIELLKSVPQRSS